MSTVSRAVIGVVAALAAASAPDDAAAQAAPFQADSVEVDGSWIYYRIGGGGPPLLLLHGFTAAGGYWEPYLDRLAEDYTTIVPDLPGHGRSGSGPHPWRCDHVAALSLPRTG